MRLFVSPGSGYLRPWYVILERPEVVPNGTRTGGSRPTSALTRPNQPPCPGTGRQRNPYLQSDQRYVGLQKRDREDELYIGEVPSSDYVVPGCYLLFIDRAFLRTEKFIKICC